MCSQSVSLSLAAPYLRQKGWSWPLSPPGQLSAVNPSLWAAQEQVCLFPGSVSNPRTSAAEKLPALALEAGLAGLLPPKATRESPCPLSLFLVDYGSLTLLGLETPFSPSVLPECMSLSWEICPDNRCTDLPCDLIQLTVSAKTVFSNATAKVFESSGRDTAPSTQEGLLRRVPAMCILRCLFLSSSWWTGGEFSVSFIVGPMGLLQEPRSLMSALASAVVIVPICLCCWHYLKS